MRGAAATLVVLALCAVAAGEDARVAEARELAIADLDAAESVLRGVLTDETASPESRVEAARASLDILPLGAGNALAGDLVLSVLAVNPSHPAAWRTAFSVRDHVLDGLDLESGVPYLRRMIEIYPNEIVFRHQLADLLVGAGRPAAAREESRAILERNPDDVRARYVLAMLDELDGDARRAVERYGEVIAIDGDLRAHEIRVRVLWDTLRDFEAADVALADAWAAVKAAPPGAERDRRWANLENEERMMGEERATRERLRAADTRLSAVLAAVCAIWVVGLGGGLALLRRRGLV